MNDKGKSVIYTVTREQSDSGYTHDRLWIATYSAEDTAKRLAGTIDNRDGYGTGGDEQRADSARRMGRVFAKMLDDGHKTHYDWNYGWSFAVRYQIYKNANAERPDYCEPSFELPAKLGEARHVLAFIEKLGKRMERARARAASKTRGFEVEPRDVQHWTFEQLQDVVAALDKVGAVRCERWTSGDSTTSYLVPARARGDEYSLT